MEHVFLFGGPLLLVISIIFIIIISQRGGKRRRREVERSERNRDLDLAFDFVSLLGSSFFHWRLFLFLLLFAVCSISCIIYVRKSRLDIAHTHT